MSVKFFAITLVIVISQFSSMSPVLASDDEVLVTNTWTDVTKREYLLELSRIPEGYRGAVEVSGKRIVEVIDKVLTKKTLAEQARDLGIDKEEGIQQRIAWLTDELLSQVRLERLEQSAMRDFDSRIEDFETRAEELYRGEPDSSEYKTPFRLSVSHILVSLENRSREEAEIRANFIRSLLKADQSFADIAFEYSDDPSAKQNKGDLGQFESGVMIKEFEDAALKLEQVGELSPAIETSYGLHIIKLNSKTGGVKMTFEEAMPRIVAKLKSDFVTRVRVKHMRELIADESMTINEEAIESLIIPVSG
jgi:peptidyl-prolyl cis-trans isomerase C